MMKKEILGILRDKKYSPNHIETDALIMRMTAAELKVLNFNVQLIYENNFVRSKKEFKHVFSMGRSESTLKILSLWQKSGFVVINSPEGVYNAYRKHMTKIMNKHKVTYPQSILIDNENFRTQCYEQLNSRKVWLKSDKHSLHREDVTPVFNKEECEVIIKEFARRNIKHVLLQEHKTGSEIKFYGVNNSDFFHWYYTNGVSPYGFSEQDLIHIAGKIAQLLKLDVYGGDAIITEKGEIYIIDFNDWPSFAPIKDLASKAIARLIADRINGEN